jgi:group II intron reverse transcriptase/maturase
LAHLADDLYRQRYRPSAPRWVEIPRPGKPDKMRRIGILTIRDRVVHTALKQVLEPILEPIFVPTSFGFRPGRSVAAALAEAVHLLTPQADDALPFAWAAHLDVADCFDTIDHRLLLAELQRHVADGDCLRLLEQVVQAGGTTARQWFWQRSQGLLQGSALSPLLCNLALHPLDEALREQARETQDGLGMLRYADDLLILGRDARLAERAATTCRRVLGRLQQQLRTPIAAPRPIQEGVGWLGVRLQPRIRPWSPRPQLGYVVPDDKVTAMLARLTEITTPPSDKIDPAAFNLARWIVSINDQMREWRQAYLFADNSPEVFRSLDEHALDRVGQLLRCVTGQRMGQLYETYRARLPRGFSTWEVPGARLTVLSSLAPHSPSRLIRRPAWMRPETSPRRSAPPPRDSYPLALPAPAAQKEEPS